MRSEKREDTYKLTVLLSHYKVHKVGKGVEIRGIVLSHRVRMLMSLPVERRGTRTEGDRLILTQEDKRRVEYFLE